MARAHTCPSRSLQDLSESMSCRSKTPKAPDSTWTVASQPWVNHTSTNFLTEKSTNKNPMSVKTDGNCSHVKLTDYGSTYGGHVVLQISHSRTHCERGCALDVRVRSGECSKVAALLSLANAERDVSALCGSRKGLQVDASSGDHVHIIADYKSGPFEIDLCVQ